MADDDTLTASVSALLDEHARLQSELSDPAVHADAGRAKKLTRRYAELDKVAVTARRFAQLEDDAAAAEELAADDAEFGAEATRLHEEASDVEAELRDLLVPSDPDDARDAIIEIKAGEGGDESALFAGDLLRMYQRWIDSRGWSSQILDATHSDLGGYKDVTLALKAKDDGAYGWVKFEGGVHRVQRVPVTESQGRIHTSAAGVLVFPEVDEPEEVALDDNDLRIDVYRSSGPGGQSVNTTDSAVRITHVPTGITASCQNEKSQLQNKEAALRMLRARILAKQAEEAAAEAADIRRSQVRTVDRSERIRTYNFPENRITDHRTGYKAYNLDQVLAGDLDPVIGSCREADKTARLDALGD
ncbi:MULTISPECIES: peptide chain release factor 1 [Brevibacterium]|uniref:Peptide chain release factor 1 n=3 Tax=Brevibacterium TaxID=1696 RepID=A0A2H1KCX5_9MICO|nr:MULTISPECIES: peptide chain release factor 1 [Brevibacterium]SMX96471.1 bacterial peptide chain release factor 1 (bRF-1) [Brevibacterium antiquum]SMX97428.1 bacterial peptide chain release factor 1 (bRF-1) [Brevibacterium antiquum CNRZ 918]HCG55391.1 peptide chain release factor 1 [Brevibacterium sp.]